MKKNYFFKKGRRAEFTSGIIIFMLVFVSLFTFVMPVSANPALATIPAANITLDTNSYAVVGVYAENIPNPGLAGYDLDINYDSSQIQIVSITRSAEFSPPIPEFGVDETNPSAILGKLTVVSANFDGTGTKGNFKLFNVKLKALKALTNVSPFTISVKDYCGPDLVDLTPTLQVAQIPDEPNVSADNQNNLIVGLAADMEYSIDDFGFTPFDSSNLPDLSGNHTVFVRWAGTPTSPPGAERMLKFTSLDQVADPQAVVGGATYNSGNNDYIAYGNVVYLTSATPDVDFYYTLGVPESVPGNPSIEGILYNPATGISIPEGKSIIKVVAVKGGMDDSSIATFTFTNKVSTPYVIVGNTQYHSQGGVPASISVLPGVPIKLGSSTGDVSFYYTLDGSAPTTGSNLYNSSTGITNLPIGTTTLKVLGIKDTLADSGTPTFVVTVSQLISSAPTPAQISVVNNLNGTDDTITVQSLHGGDIVKVYRDATTQVVLGTATLPIAQPSGSVTVAIPQLGTTAGTVYVTVTSPEMSESSRTAAPYSAESINNPLNVAIGNVIGRAGQNVTVSIDLTNVAANAELGIVASRLTVNYDETVLQLVSTTSGAIVPANASFNASPTNEEILAGANPGQIVFLESDETQADNLINIDGTYATVVFKVKDTAVEGIYPITFSSVSSDNSLTKKIENVNWPVDDIPGFVLIPGSVTVQQWVYGDLNGTGGITSTDYALMKSYLLKKITEFPNGVPLQAANLNGTGGITSTDYALLKSYLLKNITKFPVEP